MLFREKLAIFYLLVMLTVFLDAQSEPGPPSPCEVHGLKESKLTDVQVKILLKRGFLLTGKRGRNMADLYLPYDLPDGLLPVLVTIDSLAIPVLKVLGKGIEMELAKEASSLPQALLSWEGSLRETGPGKWRKGWLLAQTILAVSMGILEGRGAMDRLALPHQVRDLAQKELALANNGGRRVSALFGRLFDYHGVGSFLESPGGFSLQGRAERLVRLKRWLGQAVLEISNPTQFRAALILAWTVPKSWLIAHRWERKLFGRLDNIEIMDIKKILKLHGGLSRAQKDHLIEKKLQNVIACLPGPYQGNPKRGINLDSEKVHLNTHEKTVPGKGLLLDGPRISWDALALRNGTWGRYSHPSGLLLAGAAGNRWALKKVNEGYCLKWLSGGDFKPVFGKGDVDWKACVEALRLKEGSTPSAQALFVRFFRKISRDTGWIPNWDGWSWSREQWGRKRALTALGLWVAWRKAVGPFTRRTFCLIGASVENDEGYILPTLEELQRLKELNDFVWTALHDLKCLSKPFEKVSVLLENAISLRKKQDRGIRFSVREKQFFKEYWERIQILGTGNRLFSGNPPQAWLVDLGSISTVFSPNPGKPEVRLFGATGLPRRIYGIVKLHNGWNLCKGGILEYHEFVAPYSINVSEMDWVELLRVNPRAGGISFKSKNKFTENLDLLVKHALDCLSLIHI